MIEALHSSLFNDRIWPDFTRLPDRRAPALRLVPLEPGEQREIAGLKVSWARTRHPVFAAGYLLQQDGGGVLFSGDTGPEEIWRLPESGFPLWGAFIETSFPDRLGELAEASGHLTPATLAGELVKFGRPEVPVKVFHLKPQFEEEIARELRALGDDRLQILQGGEVFDY